MTKRRLHAVVDSFDYVCREVYQHQLHQSLNERFDVVYHEISSSRQIQVCDDDIVFSALKLRTLRTRLNDVKDIVGDNLIIIQDYDPWVSFEDGSPYKGSYEIINDALNVVFFVPSRSWCDLVKSRDMRCEFSMIGMKPEYCDDLPWEQRRHRIEFRGAANHPSRVKGFERLIRHGFPDPRVSTVIKPYSRFLEHLSSVRVWAHSESEPIVVDGIAIPRNWVWPKSIEVLSRGCFLIRERQPEASHYVENMPSAMLFNDESEAPALLDSIESMNSNERNERMRETVNTVRRMDYYRVLARRIEEWYDDHR